MAAKPVTKSFEIIDHTADVGIVAYGADLKQAFVNAAKGMTSLVIDLRDVRASTRRKVEVTAAGIENLLVDWLNELIYLFDTENFLGKKFQIEELDDQHLIATISGEEVDHKRHRIRRGVKATTYHMLEIKRNSSYRIRVLFDI